MSSSDQNFNQIISDEWENIQERIRREYELSDISYKTWIQPLKFHKMEGDTVIIIIPSDQSMSLNYINSKYKVIVQYTISELIEKDVTVSFVLEGSLNQEKEGNVDNETANHPVYNLNAESANLNSKNTFDTFVVGSNNKFAHSAALAVAESPGDVYNPLFIYGGAGLGKTHLMHAIGHYILQHNPDVKVLYVTSEQFTNEVIESIRSGNAQAMPKLREKYRTVDVLMVDDVQFIIGKESTQEEFFHTFNVLHDAGKQIILSSDKPPKEMETLEERFRSRFEWGLITDIQPPDYETRVAILQKNAETEHKSVPFEILQYIADHILSNIRELEGAFRKIIAYSRINNIVLNELTMPQAEDALKDIVSPETKRVINEEYILSVVAKYYDITVEDICSEKRNAEIALPRQVAMYMCSNITHTKYVDIAKILHKKDHTTVLHGIKKIEEIIKTDDDFKNRINIITNLILEG
jgi:chromosomal replication initiator protein